MKKANFTYNNSDYKGFIIIEDIEDLFDYFREKLDGLYKETARELVDRDQMRRNSSKDEYTSSCIVKLTEIITKSKGNGCIYNLAVIFGNLKRDWIKILDEGLVIAINPNNYVSYFCFNRKNVTLNFIKVKEYSKEDIKILQWRGGSHYYAKIDKIDVMDENGNVKWNTYELAYEKANLYLESINNN